LNLASADGEKVKKSNDIKDGKQINTAVEPENKQKKVLRRKSDLPQV